MVYVLIQVDQMSAIGTFFIWYMFWHRGPKCKGVSFCRVSQGGHIQHINVGEDIGRSCHIMVEPYATSGGVVCVI